jgi:hypothetical protein
MTHRDAEHCPECGAPVVQTMNCWDQLGLVLAWEAEDAELQAEHFLTVASYNLQHPAQFTDEAIAGLQAAFIEYLDNGIGIAAIRRRVGRVAAGKQRILRPESERRPSRRDWSMTIADVATPDRPAGAAARVRAWAASIRREIAPR